MKKRSFFERLTGNLKFDDIDDEEFEEEESPSRPHQNLNIKNQEKEVIEITTNDQPSTAKQLVQDKDEEVGELPVDVYETNAEIIIQTLIAGVMPENLSINVTRDTVVINGRREENKTISREKYFLQELYWGAFMRTVNLPAEVEIDGAEAIERHGMLLIKLPKLDKAKKTNLKVKSI